MDWFLYDIGLHHERVKLIAHYFQINDYPQIYHECSIKDQKLLPIFTVDTGPYAGNSMDTGNERLQQNLQLIVRITISITSV